MKSIKKISGDILLFLYSLQRKEGIPQHEIIRFSHFGEGKVSEFECSEKLKGVLMKLADDSIQDLYGAMIYLKEKHFIDCKWEIDSGGDNIFLLRVSAFGIDIIEGIERGKEEKNQFNVNFNIKLADNINLESLIKTEIGSLVKVSLI